MAGLNRYHKTKKVPSSTFKVLRSGKFDATFDFLSMLSDELQYSSVEGASAFEEIIGDDVDMRMRFFE